MESHDVELIERWRKSDKQLNKLYEEHCRLDKMLAKMRKKPYLTPTEEREEKMLQQKKLLGKQRLIQMLKKYEGK